MNPKLLCILIWRSFLVKLQCVVYPFCGLLLSFPPSRIQTRSAHCAQTGAGAGLAAGWGTHLAAGWGTWVFQFPENNVIILWGTGRTERG